MTGGRSLDEDYILKQAFSALVPAFDPRPGRTNVPQIQDFHVPSPGTEDEAGSSNQVPPPPGRGVKLRLSIRVSQGKWVPLFNFVGEGTNIKHEIYVL